MDRLLALFGSSLEDQMLRAEVLRELGRFSEAVAIASPIDNPFAEAIAELAGRGVAQVSPLAAC
jgi:hypothetical protein